MSSFIVFILIVGCTTMLSIAGLLVVRKKFSREQFESCHEVGGFLLSVVGTLYVSHQIVSEDGYKTLWDLRPPLTTGQPSPWAFGWRKGRNENMGNALTISMNGGVPGIASTIIMLPESNSAVMALCNLRKPPVYQIAKTAAAMAFGNGSQPADDLEDHPGASAD